MNRFGRLLATVSLFLAPCGLIAVAQDAKPGDPVNQACPISQEPVDGKTLATHDGQTIGFCCPSCRRQFNRWSDERKDVALASFAPKQPEPKRGAETRPAEKGDLYTLATCPVSGEALGSMGEPVVKMFDGREVRFCCSGCIGAFEKNRKDYLAKIDKELTKQQRPHYPLETCVVMVEPLTEDGEDIAVEYVHLNRLVRLCCKGCLRKFKKDPAGYLEKLDEAVIKRQREQYPLKTCVVGGGELGSMGEPAEMIVGNRLVRFCCAGCAPEFKKSPAKYLAVIDRAWKEK